MRNRLIAAASRARPARRWCPIGPSLRGGGGEMKTPRLATGRRLGLAAALGGALALTLALFLLIPQNTQNAQAAGDVNVGTRGIVLAWDELNLTEGSTTAAEVLVRLGTAPTGDVTVDLIGSQHTNIGDADCVDTDKLCIDSPPGGDKSNTPLTFTTQNWDTHQTIDLYAQDDGDKVNETIELSLVPKGGGYAGAPLASVAITIRDDDQNQFVFTGLTDSDRAIEVDEGTSTSSFTVKLSDNPAATVTVALTSSNPAVSVSPTTLTFTDADGATPGTTAQTVTITAGSDPNTEDETYYLRLKPSGSLDTRTRGYSIAVTVDDDDTMNDLTVSEPSLSLNESGTGNTDTFTVVLASKPAREKHVTVAIGVHGANGKRIASTDKHRLTFQSGSYTIPQTVTITGVVDKDAANETGNVIVTASQDGPFAGLSRTIPITVTDNSKDDGIVVTRNGQAVSSVTSGQGTVTANVRLPFAPTGNVTVSASPNTGNVNAKFGSNSSATFTPQNWDTAQQLTISVGSSSIADGGVTVTLSATGYTSKTFKVYGTTPPNLILGTPNSGNQFTISFDRKAGTCAIKTESVCSGPVTEYTTSTLASVLELVVGKTELTVADDGTRSNDVGTPVPFTIVRYQFKDYVVPRVPDGAIELNLLVKDRYWSVNSGVQGQSALHTIKVKNPGQATATLVHDIDTSTYVTVRIDASKAAGEAGDEWTLVPVRATGSNQGVEVTVDEAAKELRIRLGSDFLTTMSALANAVNAHSGFTATYPPIAGSNFSWFANEEDDKYSNIKFTGGFDIWEYSPPRLTNSAPTVANAIADQTVALGERIDVPLAGVFADADGDTLIYSATSSDTSESVVKMLLFGNSTLRILGKAIGTATITVTATDGRWADGLAPRSRVTVTDTFTVTVSAAPISGNAPPPDNNDPNDPPYQPPVLNGLVLGGNSDPDFDGQTLEVQHVTDDSTACLDIQWGNASNGQDVQTWDCNDTDAQKWTFEKRTSGAYQGSYRLVSKLGNYCLDNRGDFATSDRMGIWSCVGDTDGAAANQSVTIAASGDGYTLTFSNGSSSVWLVTDRASGNPQGGANQTAVSGTAGASAIWRLVSD